MKNFVIFVYFVFLFKLAFAQSLPTLPGLSADGMDSNSDLLEIPGMEEDGDSFPVEFDLPAMGNSTSSLNPASELDDLSSEVDDFSNNFQGLSDDRTIQAADEAVNEFEFERGINSPDISA